MRYDTHVSTRSPNRGMRIPSAAWEPAHGRAQAEGIPMTTLVTGLLIAYGAGRIDAPTTTGGVRPPQAARDARALMAESLADTHGAATAATAMGVSESTVSRLRALAAEVHADPGRVTRARAYAVAMGAAGGHADTTTTPEE